MKDDGGDAEVEIDFEVEDLDLDELATSKIEADWRSSGRTDSCRGWASVDQDGGATGHRRDWAGSKLEGRTSCTIGERYKACEALGGDLEDGDAVADFDERWSVFRTEVELNALGIDRDRGFVVGRTGETVDACRNRLGETNQVNLEGLTRNRKNCGATRHDAGDFDSKHIFGANVECQGLATEFRGLIDRGAGLIDF